MKLSDFPINKILIKDEILKNVHLEISDTDITKQINVILNVASQLDLDTICFAYEGYSYIMNAELVGFPNSINDGSKLNKINIYVEIESPISLNNLAEDLDDSLVLEITRSKIHDIRYGEAFTMMGSLSAVQGIKFAKRALMYHLKVILSDVEKQKLLES